MDDDPDNPYLALRRANIARNEARLRELGLLRKAPSSTRRAAVGNNAAKRPSPSITTASSRRSSRRTRATQSQSVRRSARIEKSSQDATAGSEKDDGENETRHDPSPPSPARKRQRNNATKNNTAADVAPQVYPPHSARSMTLNVTQLLHGTNETPGFLGRRMAETGKHHVMLESARIAAQGSIGGDSDDTISRISFNKFSGVQPWGNDVMFLWINLNAPNSDVINEFLENGRKVTWFGGSRMYDHSPVIQKLIQRDASVVLWCRQYLPEEKTFSPYVCLGRLSLVSYNPNQHPLAFVWALLDVPSMLQNKDQDIVDNFKQLCQ